MSGMTHNAKVAGIKTLVGACNLMPRRRRSSGKRSFLIVSSTGIGDTLWGTPAINALRRAYPDGYIGVLTNQIGAEILGGNPAIDEIFKFRRGAAGLLSLPFLVRDLRKRRLDTVFIFHSSDRIIWPISALTGATEIIGFKGQNKDLDFVLTKALSIRDDIHGIEKRLELISHAAGDMTPQPLAIYLADRDRKEADSFLKSNGVAAGTLLIGLQPGAQKPFKCWPAKNFIEVGNALREEFGCTLIVTGSPKERELADIVASGINGALVSAGALSLKGTAALISKMSLFITNDTGPMHIAFALKIPTIALFCPTDPRLCGPFMAGNVSVFERPKSCASCIGKKCLDPVCLEQITAREVIGAARSMLAEQATR